MTEFKWRNTLADDETWSVDWRGRTWTIPGYMRESMAFWFDEGKWIGGGFLTAVFENDLSEAVARADSSNLELLPGYPIWLYNNAPIGSFGSPEKMKEWAAWHQTKSSRSAPDASI